MTLSSAAELVGDATARASAVPAFNVISLETAEAVIAGAQAAGTGVLLQVSENAVRYHGGMRPLLAGCRELAIAASVPVGIHLDHFEDPVHIDEGLAAATELGVGSLMVDASRLAFDDNVSTTAAVVERARELGLWVEAELGEIGGKDGAHAPGVRTDPVEAASFVRATGVHALAVAVGSSHAMVDRSASLDLHLIARLDEALPVPLVLHGSTGVPDDQLRLAVAAGIRKVNLGTALGIAWSSGLRTALEQHPSAVDPRTYSAPARDAVAAAVERLCRVVAS